jgi:hypothetical protein
VPRAPAAMLHGLVVMHVFALSEVLGLVPGTERVWPTEAPARRAAGRLRFLQILLVTSPAARSGRAFVIY